MYATDDVLNLRRESYSEAVDASATLLTVDAELGSVTIEAHSQPHVDVQALLRDVDIDVWQEDGRVHVQAVVVRGEEQLTDPGPKADITIKTPAGVSIVAHVVTGTLAVHDLQAPTRTHVITGQTRLSNVEGAMHATTVTGSIEYSGQLSDATHHFAATTGAVRLMIAGVPNARVYAWATTGRVQCDLPLSARRRGGYYTGDHLYGVSGSGEGRMMAEVVTGTVHLGMQETATAPARAVPQVN